MAFVAPIPIVNHRRVRTNSRRPVISSLNEENPEKNASTQDANTVDNDSSCTGCGRKEGPVAGCNQDGRIIGGLGAVLNWWPIKAYRPCPEFLKAKKKYTRAGQSLDEIAFGRKGTSDDLSIGERLQGK